MLSVVKQLVQDIQDPALHVLHKRHCQTSTWIIILGACILNYGWGMVTVDNYTKYWGPEDYMSTIFFWWSLYFFGTCGWIIHTFEDKTRVKERIRLPSAAVTLLKSRPSRMRSALVEIDGNYYIRSHRISEKDMFQMPLVLGSFSIIVLLFTKMVILTGSAIDMWPVLHYLTWGIILLLVGYVVWIDFLYTQWTKDEETPAIASGKDE